MTTTPSGRPTCPASRCPCCRQQKWLEVHGLQPETRWTELYLDIEKRKLTPAASLTVSSTTTEADLFLTLRVQDHAGNDGTFPAAMDPHGGIGSGWLRSSLRKTDPGRSQPYRPWHIGSGSQSPTYVSRRTRADLR
jgi:hypothetical protein